MPAISKYCAYCQDISLNKIAKEVMESPKYLSLINKIIKFIYQLYSSREEGIRTLDTLLAYTHFPGVRLRPLGHLSNLVRNNEKNMSP